MFRFGFPELLPLLILVPLLGLLLYLASQRKRRALAAFGGLPLVKQLSQTFSWKRHFLKAVLLLTALFMLLLSLTRPQFGTRVETVKREGQDIIVAIDVSLSMQAQDIRPNRIEKAKREVSDLIARLDGDRIGLIAFAGEAFVQCPLTLDYGAARLFLSAMETGLIPIPGTALSSAVELALKTFEEEEKRNKVLILITDGEDHAGRIDQVAEQCVTAGVIVHSIGIGSSQGVPIPLTETEGQGFKKDQAGEVVLTRLNETPLRRLAEETAGSYSRISSNGSELKTLLESIATMDKKELSSREVTLFEERFQPFLAIGLFFLITELLIGESKRIKREWKGRFQ